MDAQEHSPPASASVAIDDYSPARIRHSIDLVRLSFVVVAVLVLTALGTVAGDTGRGISDDVTRLSHEVPALLVRMFSVVGVFAGLAVPIGLMIHEVVRGQARRLIEATVTGLIALGVIEGLDAILRSYPSSQLYESLVRVSAAGHVRPLDAYLAALFAFVTFIRLNDDPRWSGFVVTMTTIYIVSAFVGTQASLLSLVSSLTIGTAIGLLVRYVAGQPNEQPDGFQLAEAIRLRGIDVSALTRVDSPQSDHRVYRAFTPDGCELDVQVFDRDLIASGAVHRISRRIRLRREIAPASGLTLERVAEHRSLLAMSVAETGVALPRLVAGVPCGPDTVVLVYEAPVTTPLRAPTDQQLDELWGDLARLHVHRITHRGLVPGQIAIDAEGRVVLPIPVDGNAFATDLQISLDCAQLLTTCALLADPVRAVRSARTVLSVDELAATLPVLQPIALSGDIRKAVRRDSALIEELRDEIQLQTQHQVTERARVERVRPRTVISIVAIIVATYLLVGELGTVNLSTVFRSAHWGWVPLVLLASALTYLAAALSLIGYVRERLSFPRTVLVQLAASFAGFVTPPSVGGLAINIQYLRKQRLSTTGAATSVGMSQIVNAVSHVVLLIIFAAATGTTTHHSLPIPGWAFIAIGAAAAAGLLSLTIPATRRLLGERLLQPAREALPRLIYLLTSPAKLSEGLLGALLLNASYIGALWFAVKALDGHVSVVGVAVVYLAGAAIGSVAPTPGGLGAVEVALSTGLAAAGMSSAAAISAVLLFRIATFWLPVPIGWVALQYLQRKDAL